MYSGSRSASELPQPLADPCVAGRRRRRRPAACHRVRPRGRPPRPAPPPDAPRSTAWISPGSIRNPRIFTCSSARPANTSCPSAVHRTTVTGAIHPLTRHRTDTPRTAPPSTPADPHNPAPTPAPATYNSPTTPGGTGTNASSSTKHPRIGDRPTDHRTTPSRQRVNRPRRHHHRRLRRPVRIHQPPTRATTPAPPPPTQRLTHRRTNASPTPDQPAPTPATTATAPHCATRIPRNNHRATRRSGALIRTSHHHVAPTHNATTTSNTDASKLNDANCNTRTPRPAPNRRPEHRHQIRQRPRA